MGDRLKYERFLWFHERIRDLRYPNAKDLADHFEISTRTSQRDVEFMRERLNAPLHFDRTRKGYVYTDNSFELPAQWFSEENVLALALAVRLASTIPDDTIKKSLCRFLDRVLGAFGSADVSCLTGIGEKVSVKNIEYSKVDERCFHSVAQALFEKQAVRIDYFSPHTGKSSSRTVQPLHLMHYMGSWYLLAWCAEKRGIRDFALSRIRNIQSVAKPLTLPKWLPSIKDYTRKHFGTMFGEETIPVCLRFSPTVAAWVSEQIWHPKQEMKQEADGSMLLKFTVADFREVKRRILSYGADVEVLEPKKLREEIRKEINRMKNIYGQYDTE